VECLGPRIDGAQVALLPGAQAEVDHLAGEEIVFVKEANPAKDLCSHHDDRPGNTFDDLDRFVGRQRSNVRVVVLGRVSASGCQQLLFPLGIEEERSNEADSFIRQEAFQKLHDVRLLNLRVAIEEEQRRIPAAQRFSNPSVVSSSEPQIGGVP
jgi:hypothetical protein